MIKIFGASLIILGCGSVGFKLAAGSIREEQFLKQLISVLDYMECELQYRLTPLPTLCKQAASQCGGSLSKLLLSLTDELEAQISPDVERCMSAAIYVNKDLPEKITGILVNFGKSLGRFDLKGQLKGIEDTRNECRAALTNLLDDKDNRIRSYRTLALCAGAALAILFI